MAHITADQGRPSLLAGLRNIVGGWQKALERQRVFRQSYEELASLSDRDLADIGVARSQIVQIAWETAERV